MASLSGFTAAAEPGPVLRAGHACSPQTGCVSLNFEGTTNNDWLVIRESDAAPFIWNASDRSGIVALRGCLQRTGTKVRCYRQRSKSIYIDLYGGDDQVRVGSVLRTNEVSGGPGRDALVGGTGRDFGLSGGSGRDQLRGRKGKDAYYGGEGNDLLSAANDDTDLEINCGPGRDKAVIDAQDPVPKSCERIVVRSR